jgi:alkylation response protein AidB-like acyl-CoA dehydrogenase
MFVLDANDTSHLLLADEKGQIFVVNAKSANIEIIKLTTVDKTRQYSEVICENLEAELLENSSKSTNPINKAIDAGRIMLAADSLGASQTMLDKAVDYAKERKQFGRAIGSFQAVKHMCAEMAADLEPCYALVWHAAHCHDHSLSEARLMACHAKAHVSEISKGIAKKATEVHGGMGFTDLLGLHYWFKRIGLNRQILGSPELIREEAYKAQI